MLLLRDYRSKEMRILIAAVLCSVICLTAIAFSISSINNLLASTSASLLGGDRVISAPEPINQKLIKAASAHSSAYTETLTFYSMIADANDLMLSSVKAVSKPYPLYGELKISDAIDGLVRTTKHIPEPGTIWLEPRILLELNLQVGSVVSVGNADFKISAILRDEPDRIGDSFTFVPRAIMNMQDVESTAAVQPGSRVTYKLLVNGTEAQLKAFDAELTKGLPIGYQSRTPDTQQASFKNLVLAQNYLGLALLINLVIAAMAISIAARRYSAVHVIDAAILRCLGASSSKLANIFIMGLVIGSIILGLLGSVLGLGIQQVIACILAKYFALDLPFPGYLPLFYGVLSALILVSIAAIPAFRALAKAAPMQVLRRITVTADTAWKLKLRISDKLPPLLRLSLNNIFYNIQNNLYQVIAFAFIICVALILYNVRSNLLNNWIAQLPKDTPNYFMLNISPDDKLKLQQYFQAEKIRATDFYPIVRGTLIKINQERANVDGEEKSDQRTGINRPLNLTWCTELPTKNTIVAGAWFGDQSEGMNEISIERDIANRLSVTIGDELTFLINTQEVRAKITSIRTVEWGSFTPNFYVIYSPGVIDNMPHTYISSFYLPATQAKLLRAMVKEFPGLNIISISQMVEQAKSIISILSLVIWFIWVFTLIISLLLMAAIVLSGITERNYQNNLMRILGTPKSKVQSILSIEYLLLGATAGLIGAVVASATTKFVIERYFSSTYAFDWWSIPYSCLAGALIMWISGYISTYRVLGVAPIQSLRTN